MSILSDLKWKEFPVLDQGHVLLVDVMGDDHAICEAARISYGAGTKSVSDDRTLIRYLMRCRHTSPFEQVELKFVFRMPQVVFWQMVRHRTASVNVESGRYSEMSEDMMATPPDGWRLQSTTNKQGSGGFVTEFPGDCDAETFLEPGAYLSERESQFQKTARECYQERLKFGVAREQARLDLPMSVYIKVAWKIDLHNLLHFLSLRMDPHAQKEIRDYANVIGNEIVKPLFPICWEAFEDYRLNAMSLTALDIQAIKKFFTIGPSEDRTDYDNLFGHITNKREREECLAKFKRLGIL